MELFCPTPQVQSTENLVYPDIYCIRSENHTNNLSTDHKSHTSTVRVLWFPYSSVEYHPYQSAGILLELHFS